MPLRSRVCAELCTLNQQLRNTIVAAPDEVRDQRRSLTPCESRTLRYAATESRTRADCLNPLQRRVSFSRRRG